jgi:hypothetical protein
MAFSNLFVLLDDIATVLDDVALMTKVAAKKTAGVLGDDLALNAEQVSGVRAERELPVVWAVAKGSFKNKLILVPAALLISALLPWLITPLLMIGGGYLCFEGVEKLVHSFSSHLTEEQAVSHAIQDPNLDLVAFEKEKIQGAIRTDFVLSAEIIVIALGTVQDADFVTRLSVVSAIAIVMTIGVYGLVAGIVKLDDAGIALLRDSASSIFSKLKRRLGQAILWFAPALMKSLSVIGTLAMFLVGGSILLHGIPQSHDLVHHLQEQVTSIGYIGPWLAYGVPLMSNLIFGLLSGGVILSLVTLALKLKKAP